MRTDWVRVEYFPGLTSFEILQKIQKNLQDRYIEPENCEDRFIFMSLYFKFRKKSRSMRRDSREDTRHSSALETKSRWMELSATHLKENGTPSPHRWWDASRKPVIQYSRASVLWVVEFWKQRVTETLQCGCFEHRTRMSNDSLSKSARYLRISLKLVWRVRSKAKWARAD